MDNKELLTAKLTGYLTPKADKVIRELVETGMDRDLAMVLLELHWKDEEIFQLSDEVSEDVE